MSELTVRQLTQDVGFPPPFRQAVGEMILAFAALEGVLHDAIIEMIGEDFFVGSIMTAGLPYSSLVDRFCALLQHLQRDDTSAPGVQDIRSRLMDVSERRNALVHSNWLLEPVSAEASRIRARIRGKAGLRFDTPVVTSEEVLSLAADCSELRLRVAGLATPIIRTRVEGRQAPLSNRDDG